MMNWVTDFVHYMDTTYPRGVDRVLYTDLKYSNREKINEFSSEYPNIDRTLIEKVALHEFLMKSDNEKLRILNKYQEGIL